MFDKRNAGSENTGEKIGNCRGEPTIWTAVSGELLQKWRGVAGRVIQPAAELVCKLRSISKTQIQALTGDRVERLGCVAHCYGASVEQ